MALSKLRMCGGWERRGAGEASESVTAITKNGNTLDGTFRVWYVSRNDNQATGQRDDAIALAYIALRLSSYQYGCEINDEPYQCTNILIIVLQSGLVACYTPLCAARSRQDETL